MIEIFAKSESESNLLSMYRDLENRGGALHFAAGNSKGRVMILKTACARLSKTPNLTAKTSPAKVPDPLMPEETAKAIREMPRDVKGELVEFGKSDTAASPRLP